MLKERQKERDFSIVWLKLTILKILMPCQKGIMLKVGQKEGYFSVNQRKATSIIFFRGLIKQL
jgi:hypothetical protein